MPGPCIMRTFPTYINLTTGPDQPQSVRDRGSNGNHDSSVCTSSNEYCYWLSLGLEGRALVRSETAQVVLT